MVTVECSVALIFVVSHGGGIVAGNASHCGIYPAAHAWRHHAFGARDRLHVIAKDIVFTLSRKTRHNRSTPHRRSPEPTIRKYATEMIIERRAVSLRPLLLSCHLLLKIAIGRKKGGYHMS